MPNIIHSKEEFGDIDWDYVEKMNKKGCSCFCCGGYGFPDDTWLIYTVEEYGLSNPDVDVNVYELPNILQKMINMIEEDGKSKVKRNLKNKINGILDDLGICHHKRL